MHKKTILFVLMLVVLVGAFAYMSKTDTPALKVSSAGSLSGMPDALPTQTVNLLNGDTFELKAGYVAKEINGKKVKMLAYNGSVPGPVIRIKEGDSVTIRLVNNTDLPTLLHSHGVRMENKFDGTHLVQKDILPGESFEYKLNFPDVGIMWYHPHVREDKQQVMGLYGSFLITPKNSDYWGKSDSEKVLFLSDVLIEKGDIAPYSDTYITHALMGRFGNVLMVNGETNFTMTASSGEVQRLYLANAATVRSFNFRIPGARMKLVGGDNGRFEYETFVDAVTIHPSERVVVDVLFANPGEYRIEHAYPEKTYILGKVTVTGTSSSASAQSFETLRTDEKLVSEFNSIRKNYLTAPPDEKINLTVRTDMNAIMKNAMGGKEMSSLQGAGGHGAEGGHGATAPSSMEMNGMAETNISPIEWEDNMGTMNTFAIGGDSPKANTTWIIEDDFTKKQNEEIIWKFKKDVPVKIRIFNDPKSAHPMQHPIHFHGNKFTVLSRNGVAETNMVWKDTTISQAGETLDILLETTNPGRWLAHCHIAEHMHSGMMFEYDVE